MSYHTYEHDKHVSQVFPGSMRVGERVIFFQKSAQFVTQIQLRNDYGVHKYNSGMIIDYTNTIKK